MSCTYRTAAIRIAVMAGIPRDLMHTAMDVARQHCIAFPTLPSDQLPAITQLLGIAPTCGNPQQVITRIHAALLVLGTCHPTNPRIGRWMAVAAAIGVPTDRLPVLPPPVVINTVRTQLAALFSQDDDHPTTCLEQGLHALRHGQAIPHDLVDVAIRAATRDIIVTWLAHGALDNRLEAMCHQLTDTQMETLARAGVLPDALVAKVATLWWSPRLSWHDFPLEMWDRVTDREIARRGRARTAAAWLIHYPDLSTNDRYITAAAQDETEAAKVCIARPDLRTNKYLIAAIATDPWGAARVLVSCLDIRDPLLMTATAREPGAAAWTLAHRRDIYDEQLMMAVTASASWTAEVLIARPDLRTNKHLITAAANDAAAAAKILSNTDMGDEQLITAAAEEASEAAAVLIARPDLRTNEHLIAAVAKHATWVKEVQQHCPELHDHPFLATTRCDGA